MTSLEISTKPATYRLNSNFGLVMAKDTYHLDEGSFTRDVNVIVFVSGTFDLFSVVCKQHYRTALNPLSNGTENW